VPYQVSEQPSPRVQEEEFAKQLRLARYLAAGGSSPAPWLEAMPEAKVPKRGRPVAKAAAKNQVGNGRQEAPEGRIGKRKAAGDRKRRHPVPGEGGKAAAFSATKR
jgi:hypothetical protein